MIICLLTCKLAVYRLSYKRLSLDTVQTMTIVSKTIGNYYNIIIDNVTICHLVPCMI